MPRRSDIGSSPLSRGILGSAGAFPPRLGIIPALAGNTGSHPMLGWDRWDHPRSRGEYRMRDLFTDERNGSSPLSRGILRGRPYQRGHRGDHPRSRGEYWLIANEGVGGS